MRRGSIPLYALIINHLNPYIMAKKHYENPANPYYEAYLRAWSRYTEAYHSCSDLDTRVSLYGDYLTARNDYDKNPQTIFNES